MRLVIVSNRLPVTVVVRDGNVELREAVGGLATAIKSFLRASDRGKVLRGAVGRVVRREGRGGGGLGQEQA
jgi:trehalose-6-phosphate synthase